MIDSSDKIDWKWARGPTTVLGDFGDPVNTTNDFAFCAYDQSADPQPIVQAIVPVGGACGNKSCWKTQGTNRYSYRDRDAAPGGVVTMSLRAGVDTAARIKLKAKGPLAVIPDLPLVTPVTVQLQSVGGNCWETVFTAPSKNDGEQFRSND